MPDNQNQTGGWKESPAKTGARLLDADDQVLSKGEIVLYRDEKKALFYPHDLAQLDTIQIRAKTLLLTDTNESLGIREIADCDEEIDHRVHWHLKLS